ncbi:MAG: hypothetical protein R3A48_25520 [Polyangiales bacterium]
MRIPSVVAALVLLGCATGLDGADQVASGVRVAGPWVLPASTLAAGDRQYVPYTGSPRIADGGRCTSTNAFACSCTHPSCSRGLPGTLAFATYLRRRFPQIRSAGGFDCCRQNTGNTAYLSVHSIGRAIDLMIPTISGDADNTAGDAVANWLVANAQRIGVQLVVWDRTAWNGSRAPGTKVRPYTGPIPHVDHIHMELSVDGANRRTPFFTSGEVNGGGCTARCDGARLLGADCAATECAALGATCAATPEPRCVSRECPPTGTAFICLDRGRRAECRNGLITAVGDCGAFGSYCSVAGVAPTAARCTLSLCVSGPEMIPEAHTACSITPGRLLECDASGAGREVPCPAGQVCSVESGAARCAQPQAVCPVPAAGAPADDRAVCLGESVVARCFNGNVIQATRCGDNGICSTLGGAPHCAQRACVNADGSLRTGVVCAPGGVVVRCDPTGSFESVTRCPAGTTCLQYPDGRAFCGALDAGDDAGGAPMDDDLPPEAPDGGAPPDDAGTLPEVGQATDAAAAQDVVTATDLDASGEGVVGAGCGCRAGAPRAFGASGWAVALGLLVRRRRRAAR